MGSYGCSIPDRIENAGGGPFVGNLSFYHFNMIVSGACTVVVLLLTFSLMGRHAMCMTNPKEQIKIMRIINMIPSYQVLTFISICVPNSYVYLQGFTEVFQGIALYAFLMLLCDFLAPTDQDKIKCFSSLEIKRQWQPKMKRNGLAFLKLIWWSVLQYPIITWIAAVAQVVTQSLHKYCLGSNSPDFSHVWLTTGTSLSTSIAINAIIQFYMNMNKYMKEHHPLTKLLAFKLVVGLVILEKVLFLILEGVKVLQPSETLTYVDVMIGLPQMIICVEMVPLSLLVIYAYPTKPYRNFNKSTITALRPQEYHAIESDGDYETLMRGFQKGNQGGWLGLQAWAAYLNPIGLFMDIISAYRMMYQQHNGSVAE